MRLIIAEDERRVRTLIKGLIPFETFGIQLVGEASNGLEAIELCKQHEPDILITDINMPGLSGLAMIKELKNLLPKLKVIIISGYDNFEYAKTAIRYDVIEYILKPIDENELFNALLKVKKAIIEERTDINDKISEIKSVEELNTYINDFIQDILSLYQSTSNISPVEIAKKFVQKNFMQNISCEQLAECLHFSSSYFSELFKKETGFNFTEYRTNVRISFAKALLIESNLSINKVSENSGYTDQRHFCKLFRRSTGMSPTEYRKKFI